jgi:oxygen-independent coproporphyrinogen-3 oxidase
LNNLSGKFRTIYIGGGTPTILSVNLLKSLLKALQKHMDKISEFTIEANPESINEEKLMLFLDNGVNRISIGIQSFNDAKLKILGRIHDGVCARKAAALAHKKGFKNISIDLIFGVRRETFEDWEKDLEESIGLPVKHISCYSLDHKGLEAKEENSAMMYKYAMDFLPDRGFKQYEISNFAKDGFLCRHNLAYWNNNPYLGVGPSAVSYKEVTREENIPRVIDYIRRAKAGGTVVSSGERLDDLTCAKETAALKIRTMEGINFGWFRRKTGFDFLELEKGALRRLLEDGLIKYIKNGHDFSGVRLSPRGILFCDIVSSAFL